MIHDQKLLQTKIDTLYNVLHELNQFPDKFVQAKKDVQVEIDELEYELEQWPIKFALWPCRDCRAQNNNCCPCPGRSKVDYETHNPRH